MIVYDGNGNQKDIVTKKVVKNANLGIGKHTLPDSQGAKILILNIQSSGNAVNLSPIFFLDGNDSFLLQGSTNITVLSHTGRTELQVAGLPSGCTIHDYVLFF